MPSHYGLTIASSDGKHVCLTCVQVTRTAMAPMLVLPDQGKTAKRELVGQMGEELVFRLLQEAAVTAGEV